MVDVSAKRPTVRRALVQGVITVSPDAFQALERHHVAKGDPFTVAKVAGIQAAKRTSELIPLCHPLPMDHVDLSFVPDRSTHAIRVLAEARTTARTGIEMEAFVAAAVAALTVYDMVKAVDPGATVGELQLLEKSGGRHSFQRRARCGRR